MPPALTVLVPVHNEERTLAMIMDALSAACPDAQIVYVDDGSTDRSLEILRKQARPQDVVLTKTNGGKGSAVREGLKHAAGAYTVIQDADLEYDPHEIRNLLEHAEGRTDTAVLGSRFLMRNPNIYRRYLLGNKVMTACLNWLFWSNLTDSYTCYKLLPTSVFRSLPLTANGFELEAEICALCLQHGMRMVEVPITYRPRTIEQGKKIRFRDAVKGVETMIRIWLKPDGR